jgi:hypothetical protein
MFVDPANAVIQILGIAKNSTAGYMVQILVAFSLSSPMHAFSLPRDIPDLNIGRYAGFFAVQGFCVVGEIVTSRLANVFLVSRLSILQSLFCMLVRAAWVLGVMFLTAPLIARELVIVMVAVDFRVVFLFPVAQKVN